MKDAEGVVQRINEMAVKNGARPIVLSTVVDDQIRAMVRTANGFFLDFFDAFLAPLEAELGRRSAHVSGFGVGEAGHDPAHSERIDATNFTLANDDGSGQRDYRGADVMLIGVSRSGKTPTSLYLALQYGIKAANVPLVDEDFERKSLPASCSRIATSCSGSPYGQTGCSRYGRNVAREVATRLPEQIDFEVRSAQEMMMRNQIPNVDVTECSVEEIASRILDKMHLKRHLRT